MKLAEFLRGMPEPQRVELARQAGTTWLHLRNVAFSGKACGTPLAVGIEQATAGAVMRWDLRAEDWHRIWPELRAAADAPPLPAELARDAA